MAVRGGLRRAMNTVALGLAFAGAGAASFYFFEDFYQALEQQWPGLEASITPALRLDDPQTVGSTTAVRSQPDNNRPAVSAQSLAELRSSLTESNGIADKSQRNFRSVALTANDYGHYVVDADINGVKVALLTDTGATYVALNYQTALTLGFTPQTLRFTGRSTTANGVARVAPVTLDSLRIGSILLRDVKAVVAEQGKMTQNLLGMSFINRLAGFELSNGQLVMMQNVP